MGQADGESQDGKGTRILPSTRQGNMSCRKEGNESQYAEEITFFFAVLLPETVMIRS